MVARTLVKPEGNSLPVRLLNPRDVEVSVAKGTILAEPMESVPECNHCNIEDEPTEEHRLRF